MSDLGHQALKSCQSALGATAPGCSGADGHQTRSVAILVFPSVTLLDIAGPAQVFASLEHEGSAACVRAEVTCVSAKGGLVVTDTGIPVSSHSFGEVADKAWDTLIVPGGPGVWTALDDPIIVKWVSEVAPASRRVASVCLGAFLLGRAGLLEGRHAVTHWRYCERLSREFPHSQVHVDRLFQKDGKIWTSAGVSAGIDLALAMVEEDHGHSVALNIARRLVVFLKRSGRQTQFSALLQAQVAATDKRIAGLHDWIAGHLDVDLRIEALARQVGMSPRSFARLYVTQTGVTPAVAVERMRVEAAQLMLEATGSPISAIARTAGFADDVNRPGFVGGWLV